MHAAKLITPRVDSVYTSKPSPSNPPDPPSPQKCKVPFSILRQGPHHPLKAKQRHRIRRKRPQETRHKPPPIPPPPDPAIAVHRHSRLPPRAEARRAVPERRAQRIRHDPLLDHVARVGGQPEDLRREPARPEVDGGLTERGAGAEQAREDVVGAPPEEEERPEHQGGEEAVVEAPQAVRAQDLPRAVHGPFVEPVLLRGGILDLQPGFDVLHRSGDETHRPPGARAGQRVAQRRESVVTPCRREEVGVQQTPVRGQGAQHERVHRHPAQGGRGGALVERADPLVAHRLPEAVQRAAEVRAGGGLEAHFDRVEGVADGELGEAGEDAGDEAVVVLGLEARFARGMVGKCYGDGGVRGGGWGRA